MRLTFQNSPKYGPQALLLADVGREEMEQVRQHLTRGGWKCSTVFPSKQGSGHGVYIHLKPGPFEPQKQDLERRCRTVVTAVEQQALGRAPENSQRQSERKPDAQSSIRFDTWRKNVQRYIQELNNRRRTPKPTTASFLDVRRLTLQGHYERALDLLDVLDKSQEERVAAAAARIWVYHEKGDWEGVLTAFTANRTLLTRQPQVLVWAGRAYLETGDLELARVYLEEALRILEGNTLYRTEVDRSYRRTALYWLFRIGQAEGGSLETLARGLVYAAATPNPDLSLQVGASTESVNSAESAAIGVVDQLRYQEVRSALRGTIAALAPREGEQWDPALAARVRELVATAPPELREELLVLVAPMELEGATTERALATGGGPEEAALSAINVELERLEAELHECPQTTWDRLAELESVEDPQVCARVRFLQYRLASLTPAFAQHQAPLAAELQERWLKNLAEEQRIAFHLTEADFHARLAESEDARGTTSEGSPAHWEQVRDQATAALEFLQNVGEEHKTWMAQAFARRGQAYYQLGDVTQSRADLQRAEEAGGATAGEFGILAEIYYNQGEYDTAAQYYQKAIGFSPTDSTLVFGLAMALEGNPEAQVKACSDYLVQNHSQFHTAAYGDILDIYIQAVTELGREEERVRALADRMENWARRGELKRALDTYESSGVTRPAHRFTLLSVLETYLPTMEADVRQRYADQLGQLGNDLLRYSQPFDKERFSLVRSLLRRVDPHQWFPLLNEVYREEAARMEEAGEQAPDLADLDAEEERVLNLQGKVVLLVGAFETVMQRVEKAVEGWRGKLRWMPPAFEFHRNQSEVAPLVRGANLICIVADACKHSDTEKVNNVLSSMSSPPPVVYAYGRGQSGILRSIREAV